MTETMTRPKSDAMFSQICEVIAGGANSPVRAFNGMEMTPLVVNRAEGDTIYDLDGNAYVDLCQSWGAIMHGYTHPEVMGAISSALERGTTYGLSTPAEETLARRVINAMPCVEQLRCVSSGTEATMSAVRLARGATGRDVLIKFNGCYHGHADFFLVQAGSAVAATSTSASSAGVPEGIVENTVSLPFNDVETFLKVATEIGERLACVIIEPIAGNMGVVPATQSFLEALRAKTEELGALLIFDEVMSGFRVGLGGATAHYGIQPDLVTMGKVMGGGLPAAAFGGKKSVMDHLSPKGAVFQAGTLSGNPLAMSAGAKALELVSQEGFYDELQNKANLLLDPIDEFIREKDLNMKLGRVGAMFTFFFGRQEVNNFADVRECDHVMFGHFFRTLFGKGFYLSPSGYEACFVSMCHTSEHLTQLREAILEFLNDNVV